jgi:hypothetical protein
LRKSLLSNSVFSLIAPVRKPLPSGGRDRLGEFDEVAVPVRHTLAPPATLAFSLCGGKVGGRRVHAHCAGNSGGEQFVMDDADATADVEQRCAFDAFGLQRLDQHPGPRPRPLFAIPLQISAARRAL